MRYVLLILPKFMALALFILVFGICAIIHQQLVAMLRELIRFVYKKWLKYCQVSIEKSLYTA